MLESPGGFKPQTPPLAPLQSLCAPGPCSARRGVGEREEGLGSLRIEKDASEQLET